MGEALSSRGPVRLNADPPRGRLPMKTNPELKDLARLLRLLEKRNIAEFELEDEKMRVRVVRSSGRGAAAVAPFVAAASSATALASAVPASLAAAASAADDANIASVSSPFVG